MAACPDDIGKLRADLQGNQVFQQRYTAGKIDRASYTRLFDAAQTFATMGLEKRCQDVLAGIKELSEKAEAAVPAQPPGTAPRTDMPRTTTPGTPRTDTREPRNDRTDDRVERLRSAQPINALAISIETFVGSDVRNPENKDLGDVSDLIMAKGQITHIVIGRGGFLGMGISHHMVPAAQAKVATLTDDGRTARNIVVVLDKTDEQVKAIPRVKKERGQWVAFEDDGRASPPGASPSAPPSREPTKPGTPPRQ
jgi:hypothetical protein